jgi:hypothetical protein
MSTAGNIPAAPPGWYPDPAGTGRLRWWDGSTWTDQYSTPPQQGVYSGPYAGSPYSAGPYANTATPLQRPNVGRDAAVYNPLIWAITLLPLVPTVLLLLWNPELRFITIGRQQTPTLDPLSIFSPAYFMLVISGFVAYAVSVLLAYFDSEQLKRVGVVRPFHWAWSFLSSAVYVVGRSVIVSKVARGRGLVPIWVMIGLFILNIVVTNIKMSALMSSMIATIPV